MARTAHFVLHALPRASLDRAAAAVHEPGRPPQLSTDDEVADAGCVDDTGAGLDGLPSQAWRLGLVLPKKQARRSVTRSLIRHQAREALRRHGPAVRAAGRVAPEVEGWVVRLKTPFDRQQYPSAASEALKLAVRLELDELWARLLAAPASAGGRSAAKTRPDAPDVPGAAA